MGELWCGTGWASPGCTMDRSSNENRWCIGAEIGFEVLDECLEGWEGSEEEKGLIGEVREQFGQIFKAVQVSWGRVDKGWRAFQFQVCGRWNT